MTYKYIYKTPEKLSNMIINSDGEYLTGLWFEGSRNSIMRRCKWCNLKNEKYIEYHDKEWCKPNFEDKYLFEMLILESFQAGLSWITILHKREAFKEAFDQFDVNKIAMYDDCKINELMNNPKIIRNSRKIKAAVKNAQIFIEIQKEYGSFSKYLWAYTNDKIIYEKKENETTSTLSDQISKDLKKKGMSFVGSITIYSYLEAIGIYNHHDRNCFLHL